MIICPKCNKELEDGTGICDVCGATLAEEVAEESLTETAVETVEEEKAPAKDKTKLQELWGKIVAKIPIDFKKKKVRIWSAVIAAALVVVIVLSIVLSILGRNNYVLYLKDGDLMFSGLSNINPFQVSEDEITAGSASYTMLSKDETKIFYLDDVENGVGKLYYREVNKPKKDPVKLDSNVTHFMINESGNRVTYYKDGKLYQHNLKDREKLASDVKSGYWSVSKDGKNVVWLNTDGKAYFLKVGSDREKIDSNVTRVLKVSENCKKVWYMKDDTLYFKELKKDKVKIASDVDRVACIYNSGEVYFYKYSTEELYLKDYVIDSLKESDALMVEPVAPSLSDFLDIYDNYSDAYDAYDAAWDAYYDAREAWWDKEDRDELRADLEEETVTVETYDLYYYNGKKVKTVAENIDSYSFDYALNKAVVVYSVYAKETIEKIDIAEVNYLYEVRDHVTDAIENPGALYAAVGAKTSKIALDDVENIGISNDGKVIYAVNDVDWDSYTGTLYKIAVSGEKLKKAEKIAEAVDVYGVSVVGGKLVYLKDMQGEVGTLYLDKKKVDTGVYHYSTQYWDELDGLLYYTDVDDEDESYTLHLYKDNKSVKIAEDVHSVYVTAKGQIVYLCDYNLDKQEGDLYLYKKDKSKQIDDEVSRIVQINTWK